MELPQTQALIERSIYHALRLTTVAAGYLPDIMLYGIDNPDPAIAAAENQRYKDAIDAIRAQKGFAIELFNNAPSQQRGLLKPPRIVIETESFLPGALGLDTTKSYVPTPDGNYIGEDNSFLSQTSDFYFNLKLISNSVTQQRVLHGIMVKTLPRRGYMKWYDEPTFLPYQNIFINYTSHTEVNFDEEGMVEKTFRYEIPDVIELDPTLLGNIPAIKQIGQDDINIQVE